MTEPARVVTVKGCRLTQPPSKPSTTVRAVIEKEARDLTDYERLALGDYLAAVAAYSSRAWRLCGAPVVQ